MGINALKYFSRSKESLVTAWIFLTCPNDIFYLQMPQVHIESLAGSREGMRRQGASFRETGGARMNLKIPRQLAG